MKVREKRERVGEGRKEGKERKNGGLKGRKGRWEGQQTEDDENKERM